MMKFILISTLMLISICKTYSFKNNIIRNDNIKFVDTIWEKNSWRKKIDINNISFDNLNIILISKNSRNLLRIQNLRKLS